MSHGIDVWRQRPPGNPRSAPAGRGQKISSCMTGSEKVTLSMTVGVIFCFSGRRGTSPDGLGGIHQCRDSLKMLFIDDFSIGGYGEGILR